jgi:transcriptional regulator with XRE-family HTH domain
MEKSLGHRLRVAMVDAGLTQSQLADMVGLSRETVSKHVNGRAAVKVDQLVRYSEALGIGFILDPETGLQPVTYRSKDRAVA